MKKYAWLFILAAGVLWGSMGIFVDRLTDMGFTTLQSAALRICSAAVMYVIFTLITDRKLLKIKLRDFPVFCGLGFASILAMTCFYFLAIKNTSYSVAAILLYTAPIMVSVMSVAFFKEKFGKEKLIALSVAFLGCILVSGLSTGENIKTIGILFGLASGLAYALYSIFGKVALEKYHPYTVSTYAFVFAAAGTLFVCDIPGIISTSVQQSNNSLLVINIVLTGLITAFMPFVLYTVGLKNTEAGKAAIIASVEPLAATVCGVLKGQPLGLGAICGIVCILTAVVIVSLPKKN
jgi:drug/metabolite transporter (DMT)-like permease